MTGIIAVDGGGSSCRFLWADGGTRRLVTLGPANVSTDFDAALAVLRDGFDRLAGEVGRDLRGAPACLALAGVIDAEIAARVRRALPLARAVVEEDWQAALAGALGGARGAVAGIGTGSFLARQGPGGARALGGHGLILGDEASGGWLGRQALARALHAAEGLAPETDLTRALLAERGGVSGIVAFAAAAGPADFARLAPGIVAAAAAGDAAARALMQEGAAYLERGLAALGWTGTEPLCLLGGLGPTYRDWLSEAARAALIAPRGSALDGAEARARRFAELPA
ncbi:glucosamine kinase nucleotide-binding domain-containing protein [Roseivivax sp. CAU 1761]